MPPGTRPCTCGKNLLLPVDDDFTNALRRILKRLVLLKRHFSERCPGPIHPVFQQKIQADAQGRDDHDKREDDIRRCGKQRCDQRHGRDRVGMDAQHVDQQHAELFLAVDGVLHPPAGLRNVPFVRAVQKAMHHASAEKDADFGSDFGRVPGENRAADVFGHKQDEHREGNAEHKIALILQPCRRGGKGLQHMREDEAPRAASGLAMLMPR